MLVSPIKMGAIVPALSGSGSAPDVALNTFILIQTAVGRVGGRQNTICNLQQPAAFKKLGNKSEVI